MSEITKFEPLGTYIDENKIEGSEWVYDDGDLLIPVNRIKPGEALTIVHSEVKEEANNATLLSLNHKNLYKDLEVTAELEFVNVNSHSNQTVEIITRAVSKYDKRFSADEYYAMGYRNGAFYFAKYSYFVENGKALVYTVLYNLADEGQTRYFVDFTDEQKDALFIGEELNYNEKYLFRFSIVGDFITLDMKRRGPVVSQGAEYGWVNIISNVNIGSENDTSYRDSDLSKVVAIPVNPTNLDNKGLFGINVPNSHLRLYRVRVRPFDTNSNINLFDDKEYSREVATEFNFTFKNSSRVLLNSSVGPFQNDSNILELHRTQDVILDRRNVSDISKDDIEKIQVNNYDLNDSQYISNFINIRSPLEDDFLGSEVNAFVSDEKSLFGQYEEYFTPISINESNTFNFSTNDYATIKNAPNGEIADVLVELPSNVIWDESPNFTTNTVGIISQDKENFITEDEIITTYGGRRFFIECDFRGERRVFELGYIEDGKTTFEIDEEFLNVSSSYEGVWKYNIAYWIDELADTTTAGGLTATKSTGYGYHCLKYSDQIVKDVDSRLTEAYDIVHTDYPTISDYFTDIEEYARTNDVFVEELEEIAKALIYFNQSDTRYKELVLDVITKNTEFNSLFINIRSEVPFSNDVEYHDQFISFRDAWLRQAEKYRQISLSNRQYYIGLKEEEYALDLVNNTLDIDTITQYGDKEVRLRMWRDNNINLTETYDSDVEYYDVSQNIKDLYNETDGEVAPNELYGVLEADKILTVENGSITYAIVPNTYLGPNNDRDLFADIEVSSPFPEKSEKVRRKIKAPLTRISELMDFDFETRKGGTEYSYIEDAPISGSHNRILDLIDYEFETQYYYDGVQYFPNPTGGYEKVQAYTPPVSGSFETIEDLETYLEDNDIDVTAEQWIYSEIEKVGFWTAINSTLLYPYAISETFVNKILDVGNWFNLNDTKLGDYYRQVLLNIIETKNKNKILGEQSYKDDPFELDSWFDGFYTGTRGKMNIDFGDPEYNDSTTPFNDGNYNTGTDTPLYSIDSNATPVGSHPYYYAFNGDKGNTESWEATFASEDLWISIKNKNENEKLVVNKYRIYVQSTNEPSHWILQARVIGGDWVDLDERDIDVNDWTAEGVASNHNGTEYWTFYNKTAYDEYRFLFPLDTGTIVINDIDLIAVETVDTDIKPWGTQNSRKEMIAQLRDTTSNKFPNHSIFFVDMANLVSDNNLGFDSNYVDATQYPVGLNEEFIDNPYVNTIALSGYAWTGAEYDLSELIITDDNDVVISDETDFSFVPIENEFKEENRESYTNLSNLTFDIKDVIFEIKNNEDIIWGYDNSILFTGLPKGIEVNAEFEYIKTATSRPVYSKTNLGTTDGSGEDIIPLPNKNYISDVSDVNIVRIWLDKVEIDDYNLERVDENLIRVVFNDFVFNNDPNISIRYRTDKLSDTTFSNSFIDNFSDKRQIKWTTLTKDKFGYSRIKNNYVGFIREERDNKRVFRKGDMTKEGDNYSYTTGGTTTGRVKVRGVSVGKENEDVIAVSDIERKNNFEFKTNLEFDDNLDRSLMKTSFMFRGKFNLIDDFQYLSDYYEVVLNLAENSVALVQNYYDEGELQTNILATISDNNSVIQRGTAYTLRYSVIKDVFKVYLNKKNQKKQFLFEYDLATGPTNDNLFTKVEAVRGSLGVNFFPVSRLNSQGSKLGITTITDQVYFSDVKITTFVPNNLTFGDTFISRSLDQEILQLKSTYHIQGKVSQIGKSDDNVTYVLIGTKMFARRGDSGGWTRLGRNVKDFTISGVYVYVNEFLPNLNTLFNTYRGLFQLQETILSDSDSLNAQVGKEDTVVNKVFNYSGNVVLEIADEHEYQDISWEDEDKKSIGDDHVLWDVFDTD